jgi:phosphohistidine swiveling domain-containing protein
MAAVLDLADPDTDLGRVGGKALNLGVLLRANFPVPPGFCVTTSAYRDVVGDRLDGVVAALAGVAASDQASVARLAAEARESIRSIRVPEDLADQIRHAYAGLGDDSPVAVRSSATAEDLASASFAGQQDTYLNVVGAAALLDAIRDCWASLWTDRAVTYRITNGVGSGSLALAVVVQRMLEASTAGVMFTANPVSGARTQTVIDASPGLGESVVSGAVNPDRFVVDTESGEIADRRIGDKRSLVRARAGGGTEQVPLDGASDSACLTDEQVRDLAALGSRVADHFGAPQDTEWAIDEAGTLWLTQARPITTLYPAVGRPDRAGARVFLCMSLAQGLTRPITTMGQTGFKLMSGSVLAVLGFPPADPLEGPTALQTPGERLYIDATAGLRHPVGRRIILAAMGVMEARAAWVFRALTEDARFSLLPLRPGSFLRAAAGLIVRARLPLRVLTAVVSPEAAYMRIARLEQEIRRQLTLPETAAAEERLDLVEGQLSTRTFLIMPIVGGFAGAGFLLLALARHLLRDQARGGELQTVLRGLGHNVTTEMDLALWRLTEEIRSGPESAAVFDCDAAELTRRYADGQLPPVAQRGMTEFLARYGHRAVAEIDLGMPRWSEDPSHLFGVIKNYLQLDEAALAPSAQFAAGAAEAEAMVAELTARARSRSRLRAGVVAFSLRRTRQLAGLRESPKFLLVLQLGLMRHSLRRVGEALASDGVVEAADDVFFVDLADARRGLAGTDLRPLVAAHREAYEAELTRRHIPRILLSDGTEPEALLVAADAPEGALVGTPASAGTVTGRARVILDPAGAQLEPGEILVAPSTDPGWTPLFLTAGGLVMEMGGSNSHGAVVAREYGIPAVVGVPHATHAIATGDEISVDGAAGLVTVAASAAAAAGADVEASASVVPTPLVRG